MESHRRAIGAAFLVPAWGVGVLSLYPAGKLMGTVGYSWMAAFYAPLLTLVVVRPGAWTRAIFGNAALERTGILAYAIYPRHNGVNGLCHYVVRGQPAMLTDGWSLAIAVLSFALVISLAEGSWQWIEGPLIRGGHPKFRYLARAPEASSSGSLLGRPFVSENPVVRIVPD